jgi:uncharacterized protein with PhoU and TrkA domain
MSRSAGEEQGGMSSSADILDSLLPLLQPEGRELHLNAVIVEVAEPAQLAELDLHGRYDLLPLAIRQPDGAVKFNPRDQTVIESGDVLVVMGEVANAWKARDAAGNKIPHRASGSL